MVRLSKIYTRVGDAGQTMLGDGSSVSKASARVNAYGEVDEANACIGVVIAGLGPQQETPGLLADIETELLRIQHDLFDLGADLCVPIEPHETPASRLRITQHQVDRLENAIDRFNEPLRPLDSFVLPGGTLLASHLHVARTVTRRAERSIAALHLAEPEKTSPLALIYLNRLSDLLFVLARAANRPEAGGEGDVLWKPGANR
ncbi:MAG: cob(I)yrinic acid a,c-diamide adenosyltransferase [Phycisphaerae bacterium]|nr:cob(I)yrinic acid a,c-diamide adenosyltransferase [Phycisphaerae bacterium]